MTDQPETGCCVCGGGPVVYRNYRDLPFCWPCADCRCAQNPCVRTGVNDPAVSAEVSEPPDSAKCSGEEGFCDAHGFHRHAPTADEPHPTDCRCACDGCRHHNAHPIPDPRAEYVAAVEAAIGPNVDCGGIEGVHRVRDAVLAVRDLELEQARASREQWRQEVLELAEQVKALNAKLDAIAQAADLIRADADHHDGCLLEPNADGGISHSSIAAGLRIALRHLDA
ncbi:MULTISPECIES: hypothetical protein [Actinomycetes]|uniref:Uncharacterized protein n=2 Tax=Actinomycetes TaxID=1760 RepID=A0ABN2LAJ1_9ACTN|nr:hypothetical protein [Streptomyces virginiae]